MKIIDIITMNLLITGFEPFGKWDVNPTEVAVIKLDCTIIDGFSIVGEVLPLRYNEIQGRISELIRQYNPVAIILTGQAGGDSIRIEKIAKNYVKTRVSYNCGTMIDGEKLLDDSPDIYPTSLPIESIFEQIKKEDIPVIYSENAGSFGCNQVFYLTSHLFNSIPSGFIHVPLLPQQAQSGNPSMSQEMITKALKSSLFAVTQWLQNK